MHLHVSLGDKDGKVYGGHLVKANVFTTLEVVVGCFSEIDFERVYDDRTGFKELRVKEKRSKQPATLLGVACASVGIGILISFALNKIKISK